MILEPGDIAIDFSGARPAPAAIVAAGVRLVVRYDSPNAANPKNLTKPEAKTYHHAGLGVLVVFEARQLDPLNGAVLGAEHGAIHQAHMDALGYPDDDLTIIAVDFDTQLPQIPTILDYIRAFGQHSHRPRWVYGEADLVDACFLNGLVVGGWQTVAWSHHRISPNAMCLQHATPAHPSVPPLGNVDDNTVLHPFKAWSTVVDPPVPPPIPTPSEDSMNYYVVAGSNARFIGFPGCVQWTGPGTDKMAAAIAVQLGNGNLVETPLSGPNSFVNTFLQGPLPTGDALHTWTGDEFAALLPNEAAAGTVDQKARDDVANLQGTVASLDTELGRVKSGLVASGS